MKPKTTSSIDRTPVYWIEPPETNSTAPQKGSIADAAYIDLKTISAVVKKAAQAAGDPVIENKLDELFDIRKPQPWALFPKLPQLTQALKRLFQRKVMQHVQIEKAIDALDDFFEEEQEEENADAQSLYELFFLIRNLDEIIEEISNKLFACLKT